MKLSKKFKIGLGIFIVFATFLGYQQDKKEKASNVKTEEEIVLENYKTRILEKEKVAKEQAKKAKDELINKVPRLHPWDGVAVAIKNYLKKTANDPASVEYVTVYKIYELSNGMFAQRIAFRAKNGFGALVLNDYIFLIKGNRDYSEVLAAEDSDSALESLGKNNVKIVKSYDLDDLR